MHAQQASANPLETAQMTYNKTLQLTLDPAGSSADAEAPSASSAAEHRRCAATRTTAIADTLYLD